MSYFGNPYNLCEFFHYILFWKYYFWRLSDTESTYPPSVDQIDAVTRPIEVQSFLSIMNVLIFSTGVLKFLNYMRITPGFGDIIDLIGMCLKDVSTFAFFYVFLLLVYGELYQIGGVNAPEKDDYEASLLYWLSVFRYSVGDVFDLPSQPFWDHYRGTDSGSDKMLILNILVFFSQIILMMIVLLNFLIAVVSQSYEFSVSQRLLTNTLKQMDVVLEVSKMSGNADKVQNPFIMSFPSSEAASADWQGFVGTMKTFQAQQMKALHKEFKSEVHEMKQDILRSIQDLEKKI